MKIGILNPGKMGSSLAIAGQRNGHEVFWASSDRSQETTERANNCALKDLVTVEQMCKEVDLIVSICMGSGVFPNAKMIVDYGFNGIYVDANHIGDPSSEKHLASTLRNGGVKYVEASIYGWPYPHDAAPESERTLYLFGEGEEQKVYECFDGDIFQCIILPSSSKEVKRNREIADRGDCAPFIDHGYGVIEFPQILTNIQDSLVDDYIEKIKKAEPDDYYIDEEGFYVNRGGYKFTPDQISSAPKRFLNLVSENQNSNEIEFNKEIDIAVTKCINAYKGIFPEILDCLRWRSSPHIAEYPTGSGMGMHHDNSIGGAGENENPVFNVLSVSLILSDRCEGGELVFKYPNVEIPPQKGNLIMYPSGFLGSHSVKTVLSGTRISYLEFIGQGSRVGQKNI